MYRRLVTTVVALLSLAVSLLAVAVDARVPPRARRVVLLETPSGLERALRTALMPWGMKVARPETRARPTPPRNPEQARALARQLRADALVWIAPSARRHELWLYDGSSGALTARGVPAPPFDETRSAALALSVKTELRKGTLADAAPAVVSDAAAKTVAPAGKESTLEQPEPSAPEPPEERPPLQGEASPATPPPPAPPSSVASAELDTQPFVPVLRDPSDAPSLKLVLHASVRHGATTQQISEGRYAVEGRWAPWADPAHLATIWLAARFDMGLPESVEHEAFTGEYSELGGGLGLGVSVRLSRWFDGGMQLGTSLRSGTLAGTLTRDSAPAEKTRLGVDLHLRPEVELSLGALGVLIQPALGMAIRRQRFVADDQVEVLETSGVWWQLGAGVRVALD